MKITPLEIRQKTFEKAFRGLDKDEVQAFLNTLSQEWEKVVQESKELAIKLEASEKEVQKLREVESSLFKTLKTAEDTGANLIDQATKSAELHMKETQMKAEAVMNEAKSKARELMEEAETYARKSIEKMEDELKEMADNYRDLESHRENLLDELTRITNENMEKLNRARSKMKSFDVSSYLKKSKVDSFMSSKKETELSENPAPIEPPAADQVPDSQEEKPTSAPQVENDTKDTGTSDSGQVETRQEESNDENKSKSFFDNI